MSPASPKPASFGDDPGASGHREGPAVVPSINIFHYDDTDHMKAAEADTKRMINRGDEYFQIDSPYDVWLR